MLQTLRQQKRLEIKKSKIQLCLLGLVQLTVLCAQNNFLYAGLHDRYFFWTLQEYSLLIFPVKSTNLQIGTNHQYEWFMRKGGIE